MFRNLENINKTCRTCSIIYENNEILLSIFDHKNNRNIIEELIFLKLQVSKDDNLPQQICNECFKNLTNINTFRIECEKSQKILKERFSEQMKCLPLTNEMSLTKDKLEENQCDICDHKFRSKIYLNKHKQNVHCNEHFDCEICLLKFQNSKKFQYHLKSHSENKIYKCLTCNKSFLQKHHLKNHEKTHTGQTQKPFLCNICGKDFKQQFNFKHHLSLHGGTKQFICKICDKSFVHLNSLKMHQHLHSGNKLNQCEFCGKSFIQKSTLNVHLRTHTGEKPYKCDNCERCFVQAHQLKYHKFSVHKITSFINAIKFTEKTNKSKYLEKSLAKDKITNKNNLIYPYRCPFCKKGFKLPSSLNRHILSHSEERKYTCTECGSTFKRSEHLRIHIDGVHLKKKPYQCEFCNKTFSQSGDRNLHMKSHTNEKPHKCQQCDKDFKLLKSLKAHLRIHTGEKPFICAICQKNFMTYNALALHTMKHNQDDFGKQ